MTIDPRGVATLMLNRPERHNAFDAELISHLQGTLIELEQNHQVRVVVLTGAGKSFCAGGDLQHMLQIGHAGDAENFADALAVARCLRKLDELSKPVIARINGNAFGGGVGLIACADIAIASEHSRYCLSEVRLGLAAAVISPYVVAAIGVRQARRWMLTGASFSAPEALQQGLIHQYTDATQLDQCVEQQVGLLLQGGPEAQAAGKQLLRELNGTTSEERDLRMARTARVLARLRAGGEAREGLQAFLDKRKPGWAR
ncbi:MAG: enoyl-CoA hydratase-related protein [Polyangiaceae bacterium]